HAPSLTLVNLETTFYTRPQPVTRALTPIGFDVDVRMTPTAYLWHWGDGASTRTDTPGQPFPSKDVTHTYLHTTAKSAPLVLSVDTTHSAPYLVDRGSWEQIPDALTIAGTQTTMPVKEATAVLVAGD